MKKILSIALCAAAVSAFAAPTEVELGAVGVTAITSSLQNTIVAVSYDDLASGSGMVVSNFVKTANLTEGDQLAIYNDGEYTSWILTKGEGGAMYWAKNDKTFKIDAEGKQIDGTGPLASDTIQAVGTGIWLCRKSKPSEAFTFYIYGKPASDLKSTITGGTWTLIGNPKQEAVNLGKDKVEGAAAGDQIVAIDAGGVPRYYAFTPEWGWQRNNQGNPDQLPSIGAGLGVWIRTAKNAIISW